MKTARKPVVGMHSELGRMADDIDRIVTTLTFIMGELSIPETHASGTETASVDRRYKTLEVNTVANYGTGLSATLVFDTNQPGAREVPEFNECGRSANEALRIHLDMVGRLKGLYAEQMGRAPSQPIKLRSPTSEEILGVIESEMRYIMTVVPRVCK